MCLQISYKEIFFTSLKSQKKGVGSGTGAGSGSICQRCGSGSAPQCHGSPTLAAYDRKLFQKSHVKADKC